MPAFSHPGDGLILDMDRHLKERLVGATVLVLIAVLFVPELLSGPPRPRATPPVAEISDVPTSTTAIVRTYTVDLAHPGMDHPASQAELPEAALPPAPQTPLPSAAQARSAPEGVDSAAALPANVPVAAPAAALPGRADPATSDASAVEEEQPVAAAQARPAARPPAARTAPAVTRPPPAAAPVVTAKPANSFAPIGEKGGWSIQLGSFASKANAEKLARGLRSKGIRVYVSQAGGKNRVRAGPFADRASADRMAGRLRAQGQSVSIIAP